MKSIKFKIVVSVCSLFILAFTIFFVYSVQSSKRIIREEVERALLATIHSNATIIENLTKQHYQFLDTMSNWSLLYDDTPWDEKVKAVQYEMKKMNYSRMFLVDLNGNSAAFNPERTTTQVSYRDYYKTAVAGTPCFSEVIVSNITGQAVMVAATPVKRQGKIIGVLYGVFEQEGIQKISEQFSYGETGFSYIVHENGGMITSNNRQDIANRLNLLEDCKNNPQKADFGELLKKHILKREVGVSEYTYNGLNRIAAYAPIKNQPWSIVVAITPEEVFESINRSQRGYLIIGIVGILMLVLMIYIVVNKIIKPIKELTLATDDIAKGNLDRQISIETNDEIGNLASRFNTMAKSLKNTMSEIEKMYDELLLSEEKFSKVFENASDVIGLVSDSDKKINDINRAFLSVFGYSREEVVGKTTEELGLWCDDLTRQKIDNCIDLSQQSNKVEVQWRTRQGEERVGMLSTNHLDVRNKPYNMFIWHDITDRKQAEKELKMAYDNLEITVKERTDTLMKIQERLIKTEKLVSLGTLVAGVAHEINTPLGTSVTAITYYLDLLSQFEEQYKNDTLNRQSFENFMSESNEATKVIIRNLNKAIELVESFKQVSVDRFTETRRKFNVKTHLDELLMTLNSTLKNTNQSVVISCDEELEVNTYPGSLAQVITNLIMNSITHAYEPQDKGIIGISVSMTDENNFKMVYKDDGRGIESDVMKRLFDPFFTTKRKNGNTGLGLHIVYNIVTLQLNGTIECESILGVGTTFKIEFPLSVSVE